MHCLVENVGNILQNTIQYLNHSNNKTNVKSWFPSTTTLIQMPTQYKQKGT